MPRSAARRHREELAERAGGDEVGDAVGAGDDGVEAQRAAQEPRAGEQVAGRGDGGGVRCHVRTVAPAATARR
jgi:hypothetical protein